MMQQAAVSSLRSADNDLFAEPIPRVTGILTYLADREQEPVTYMKPGAGEPERIGDFRAFEVDIHDGRSLTPPPSLDLQGFTLLGHRTGFDKFDDDVAIRAGYYGETEALLQELLGASRVVAFDHNRRVQEPQGAARQSLSSPVRRVHNDYTTESAPQRVRDLLGAAEAENLLRRRFAFINLWRPLREPVLSAPLALADASSVAPEDLVVSKLVYDDRVGLTYAAAFSPRHRWYYFPKMTRDEVILIKCFDSRDDGRARLSLHTAFDDPTAPADAAPRDSIEVRTMVFF